VELLLFESFDSFMYALDVLGYGFMSLAILFATPAFGTEGLERAVRRPLFANGLLAPVVPAQVLFPPLLYVSALWIVTFPLSRILLAILFKRRARDRTFSFTPMVCTNHH
jgi:hypothetical protein